ncbi:MAG: tRNA 2-thiouridine(34) synthase MnmA [Planctomycetota bacterium]|nr:MAG: tRNA 2-thiouridine(34) synthase MnmA [Planctomycetota bacterium]
MGAQPRVLAALSGGVDSSVAALLLKQQGYSVVGAFLRNGVSAEAKACRPRQGCCSVEDARDAARVADLLDIPFHALDMAEEFRQIQSYFRREYQQGRTPNPCAVCNRDIKFGALLAFADAVGAEFIATGHYARLHLSEEGPILRRGVDRRKDQSYVLFPVGAKALARTLLPLGDLPKSETRRLAKQAGLPVFGKADSQEICFVPSGDYRDVLRAGGGLGKPGRFVSPDGRVLGTHGGHMAFTRGQRRGLGLSAPHPLYVLHVDPLSGDVWVGRREQSLTAEARVRGFTAYGPGLELGGDWQAVEIQHRSSPGGVPGRARWTSSQILEVQFQPAVASVTPGQGLAIYQEDRLLGGGWIESAPLVDLPVLAGGAAGGPAEIS